MINQELGICIAHARKFAHATGGGADLVHILLALVEHDRVKAVLREAGVDYLDIRGAAMDHFAERELSSDARGEREPGPSGVSDMTLVAVELATRKASARKASEADVLDMIEAMLEIQDGDGFDFFARTILNSVGLSGDGFRAACRRTMNGRRAAPAAFDRSANSDEEAAGRGARDAEGAHRFGAAPDARAGDAGGVDRFCVDLTRLAREGRLDRSHARDDIICDLEIILSRRKKANPILVGEPGVGKTSLVEELACRISEGRVGPGLRGATILALDLGALVGGTKFRGDLEERIRRLVAELEADRSKIVFIDEIHALVAPGSSMAASADLFKPALAAGSIRCIGATTAAEYKRYFEADAALSRRFMRVSLSEPTRDQAVEMVMKSREAYETAHEVSFSREIVELVVDQTVSRIPERCLPDKAIDVLDEIGARCRIAGLRVADRRTALESVAARCGRPAQEIGPEEVANRLREAAPGHDEAALKLARALARNMLPGGRSAAPLIAVTGPASVDKERIVRSLAEASERPFAKIDLSEYREAFSVNLLFGAPPGYVGFEGGGRLYDAAVRARGGILFLKSADSAHPSVATALKECLSGGTVTDATGRTASLRNLQVVTSFDSAEKSAFGFCPGSDVDGSASVSPLIGEGADVVVLGDARAEEARSVIRVKLEELAERARLNGRSMRYRPTLAADIAAQAGAGPLGGVFRELVETPVLDYLVDGSSDFVLSFGGKGLAISPVE